MFRAGSPFTPRKHTVSNRSALWCVQCFCDDRGTRCRVLGERALLCWWGPGRIVFGAAAPHCSVISVFVIGGGALGFGWGVDEVESPVSRGCRREVGGSCDF